MNKQENEENVPVIETNGTSEEAKIIRSMIEHENILLNNRITWALTTQGFLIASTGFFLNKEKLIVTLISVLGILLSISFRKTLGGNNKAIENLYEHYGYKNSNPPVIGNRETGITNILLVWNLLPFALIAFWIAIIINLYI